MAAAVHAGDHVAGPAPAAQRPFADSRGPPAIGAKVSAGTRRARTVACAIRDHRLCRGIAGRTRLRGMITTVKHIAPLALLYAVRRYFRDWGATKGECKQRFPGDELVDDPAVQMTEAVWIEVPPSAVWPWLAQIGLDRGGLYLPEGLGALWGLNFHNVKRVHPKWQQTVVGDPIRVAPEGWLGLDDGVSLAIAEVVPDQCLVLRTTAGLPLAVWSFLLVPQGENRSRLLVRSRAALRHPGAVVGMELVRPVAALTMRAVLHGIKRHAEAPRLTPVAAVPAPNPHRM